jgi:hypothetical protein
MATEKVMMQGLENLFKPQEQFKKEERYGKQLYVFAWILEFIAVGIGLFVAVMTAQDAYANIENPTSRQMVNGFAGALPFFAIAVVELAKIPLAGGFYACYF